jgi:hypothetical protein
MATTLMKLKEEFIQLLLALSRVENAGFTGIGLVLYDNIQHLANYHCSLIQQQPFPPLQLGTQQLMAYFTEISSYDHPYHDGFHFINGDGILTHVAQFFSPPINQLMPDILGQGARTFCSQCGSSVPGVLMTGAVSSSRAIYLFEQGQWLNNQFAMFSERIQPLAVA